MQAVAAEFSGCAVKFCCFLEEEFKTHCSDSFIFQNLLLDKRAASVKELSNPQ